MQRVRCSYCGFDKDFDDNRRRLYCSAKCAAAAMKKQRKAAREKAHYAKFLDECFFAHGWEGSPSVQMLLYRVYCEHGKEVAKIAHEVAAAAILAFREIWKYRQKKLKNEEEM